MDKNEHFYLGTISRKFSFKGEVILQINPELNTFPKEIESVFVEIQQKRIPYFIEFTKNHKKNSIRLKFEDVNSELDAEKLVKEDVYILKSEIDISEEFGFKDLIGFKTFDKENKEIGEIVGVNTSTLQEVLEIQSKTGLVLIPVNEDWILEIDENHKEIYFDLPDGLLNLNI